MRINVLGIAVVGVLSLIPLMAAATVGPRPCVRVIATNLCPEPHLVDCPENPKPTIVEECVDEGIDLNGKRVCVCKGGA